MRWFKHMVGAGQGSTMAKIRAEFGLEGVGLYWLIVETVAARMGDGERDCAVVLPEETWRRTLGVRRKKLESFLVSSGFLFNFYATSTETNAKTLLEVRIPKLLELQDEWRKRKKRNSGVTPEQRIEEIRIEDSPPFSPQGDRARAPANRASQPKPKPPDLRPVVVAGASDPYLDAYAVGMGAEPGSLRRESGMFSVLQRLANASALDPSEVEEVAGYYRAEVAGYHRGHASFQSFVARYQEIRMRGRAGPPKGRRERDRERFAETQAELARRFGT